MKSTLILSATLLCLAISAAGQTARVFDNFDTSRGVSVAIPPPVLMPVKAAVKKKRNAQGKWVVVVQDNLVKKTAQVTPTTKNVASVTDGLATRENPNATYSKLLMGSASQLKGFTTGDVLIDSYIVDSSRRFAIDPLLIYSQMHQESSFKLRATSNKGASGLMQLMPGTARRMGVSNIYDPKQNIEGGVKYMRLLLDMFGQDVNLALAGYNAGEGAVMKYGNQIPPYSETQEYVRRISSRYTSISDGSYARTVKKVSSSKAAKLEEKDARPLTVYEPNAVAIRLPDGRIRLINQ
ncbi:MAG: lytic transglycosylase domain-containing protein [Acidobacteriota bacterium]